MAPKWTSYKKGDDYLDAVCFPNGCREQYLVHPGHSSSTLADRGIILSGISYFVPPYLVSRKNCGYHVVFLTTGGAGELLANNKKYKLRRGDLFVAPSKCTTEYRAIKSLSCVWFHLRNDAAWATGLREEVHVLQSRYVDLFSTLSEQYLAERRNRLADSHAILEAYANLIVLFLDRELRQVRHSRKTSDLRSRIEQGWEDVCANLAFPWTVENLAQKAGMSPSQFNRVVKRLNKMTPMAVVANYRMQRASEMLVITDHTLEAIAASVGYETAFAFSRAFKRHKGKSPSEFRRGLQSD